MSALPTIKRFKPIEQVGAGSFATVYLCEREKDKLKVACKIIGKSMDSSGAKSQGKGLEREMSLLKNLNHPNIVRPIELINEKARAILVMEYVAESVDLTKYLDGGRLSTKLAMKVLGQIVMALKHCHDQNIVHRDLKPENILINPKTQKIKLIDFGIGREVLKDKNGKDSLVTTVIGTPYHFSPELISRKPYQAKKNDIWSLGILLFNILTKRFPFEGGNYPALVKAILKGEFKVPSYVEDEMKDLIRSMLNKNPEERISLDQIIQHPLSQKYQKYFVEPSNNVSESKSKESCTVN